MNVLDLFDALHPGPSWRPWRAFVAAVYGEPLDREALALFRQHTNRSGPRPGGHPEGVALVGVQSGKSKVASTLADHAALTGERGTHAVLVGQDHRGAMRALLRYAREPFETLPPFRAEVTRETADTLELRRGTTLTAYPCRPAAVRGLRACIVVCDELAFYVSTDGRPTDVEMLRVARGRVATTGGKLVVLSSPYAQAGALYELHRRHYGRDDSETLVWQASAPAMNPTLPPDYLRRMEQDDPEAYRSEVLGEFRAGVTTFLDADAVAACVAEGVRERLPQWGCAYVAHFDASGGRRDAAALAIAHFENGVRADTTGRAVLDVLRAWPAPHNPVGVVAEACELLRRFGITEVQGDRYGAEFVAEQFRTHGVAYVPSERDTSSLFLELQPLVNAHRAVLLDLPDLVRELRSLQRQRGSSGRDRVSHPPGGHDDRAAACAGALVRASLRRCGRCDDPTCDGTLASMPLCVIGSATYHTWLAQHALPDGDKPGEGSALSHEDREQVWLLVERLLLAVQAGDEPAAEHADEALQSFIASQDARKAAAMRGLIERVVSAGELSA